MQKEENQFNSELLRNEDATKISLFLEWYSIPWKILLLSHNLPIYMWVRVWQYSTYYFLGGRGSIPGEYFTGNIAPYIKDNT